MMSFTKGVLQSETRVVRPFVDASEKYRPKTQHGSHVRSTLSHDSEARVRPKVHGTSHRNHNHTNNVTLAQLQ